MCNCEVHETRKNERKRRDEKNKIILDIVFFLIQTLNSGKFGGGTESTWTIRERSVRKRGKEMILNDDERDFAIFVTTS